MRIKPRKANRNKKLSVILLSHKPGYFGGGYLEHSISSLIRQNYQDFEVILLDNNKTKTKLPQNISNRVNQIIHTGDNLPIGIARNMGVERANEEVIVFLDDDTFLVDSDTLYKLNKFSQTCTYGYGARRFWTYPRGFFEANLSLYLEKIKMGDREWLLNGERALFPQGLERVSGQKELYHFTFPGNFCFVNKKTFFDIGGYASSFNGYGCEDDYFGYCLYRNHSSGFKLLSEEIAVLHVNHPINGGQKMYDRGLNKNRRTFQRLLSKDWVKAFNINVLFNLPNYKGEPVIE